jgi:hypothetical protein
MSSPYEGELGDWNGYMSARQNVPLAPEHEAFFSGIRNLPSVERDDALRKRAIQQIKTHPRKALGNWAANIGRLLFSYPFSFTPQKLSTYFYLIPNMFIVVLAVLSVYPSIARRALIPREIFWLLSFGAVTLLASSLVSAYEREFLVIVPIILLWVAFTVTSVLDVRLRDAKPVVTRRHIDVTSEPFVDAAGGAAFMASVSTARSTLA